MKQANLAEIVYQDTWDGMTVTMSSDGTALDDNLVSVRMFFREKDGTLGLSLSSPANITINNAAAPWKYTVAPITPFPLAAGTWFWSVECTNSAGVVKTRFGGTKTVIKDATYTT